MSWSKKKLYYCIPQVVTSCGALAFDEQPPSVHFERVSARNRRGAGWTRTSPVDVPDQADLFASSCSDFNDQLRKFVPVVTLLLPVHVWRSPQTVIYILIARRDNSGGRTLHKKPLLVDAVGSSYLNSQFVHDLDLLRIFNHILISVHHHKQRSPEFIAITGLWWRRPLDLICSVLKASFATTGWQKALLPSEDFCSRK